jgi:SAM-dependent methyltransferase
VKYPTVGHRLPEMITARLFGNRTKFGLSVQADDPCWREWQATYLKFYYATQRQSVGSIVNNAGYHVMRRADLTGKQVLEIGPGDINHIDWWRGKPARYVIADIQQAMLDISSRKLAAGGVSHECKLMQRGEPGALPFGDGEFDMVVSFYSLEHLYPLAPYVDGIVRILKPGGMLIGAIPAEGGIAWGMGRFLTSRRWFKKHTTIDPDKLICWEHPNFADHILTVLDEKLQQRYQGFWPLGVPSIDVNLVIKFVYVRRDYGATQ